MRVIFHVFIDGRVAILSSLLLVGDRAERSSTSTRQGRRC